MTSCAVAVASMSRTRFYLRPRPPFRLDLTAWALRRQPHNGIDRWDGTTYTRVLVAEGAALKIEATQEGPLEKPRLAAGVSSPEGVPAEKAKRQAASFLRKVLGTSEDLGDFYGLAGRDAILRPLANRFAGLKPPRFPTMFEAIINAFACQQLSLNVGITLLNRLSETYGASFRDRSGSIHAFPGPEDLANATPASLRKLGFSRTKGNAILTLARSVLDKRLDLENVVSMNDQEAVQSLQEIAGVGRWSAEYVMLRGMRRLSVFPGDDVGAQNNLRNFFSLKEKPDYAAIKRIMLRWEPYQGFVYFHFLLQKLRSKGLL